MSKVFLVGHDFEVANMFRNRGWHIAHSLKEADLVQYLGGSDVSPDLYNEHKHVKTFHNPVRDRREQLVYEMALKMNIPQTGICRGGQFLNVMCGGKMWQHVNNHIGNHAAFLEWHNGAQVTVTSTHHQMMIPAQNMDHHILMSAYLATEKHCMTNRGNPLTKFVNRNVEVDEETDVEAIWYPKQQVLCFQPHPEYSGMPKLTDVYFDMINDVLVDVEV